MQGSFPYVLNLKKPDTGAVPGEIDHVFYDVACLSYPYFGPNESTGFNEQIDPWLNPKEFSSGWDLNDHLRLTQNYYDENTGSSEAYELFDELIQECVKDSTDFG